MAASLGALAPAAGAPGPAPEADLRQVTVLGEVAKPGTYTFVEGATLSATIALAGGATEAADLGAALLRRGGQTTAVDLRRAPEVGDKAQALQPGDVITIPAGIKVYALGAVQRPGIVLATRGMGPLDLLLRAGGLTARANPAKAAVVRVVDGKPKAIRLDLKRAMLKPGPGSRFELQDGDVLFVPGKGGPLNWPWPFPRPWHTIASANLR